MGKEIRGKKDYIFLREYFLNCTLKKEKYFKGRQEWEKNNISWENLCTYMESEKGDGKQSESSLQKKLEGYRLESVCGRS